MTDNYFNDIYKNIPTDEIPWNNEQPQELLVELVESGKIRPGRTLDLGCGLGNYAIWFAEKGFEVVGIDGSPTAIKIARQNAGKRKLTAEYAENVEKKIIKNHLGGLCGLRGESGKCKFAVADLTGDWPDLGDAFDFVYDWGLLHHIFPEKRDAYVETVHRVIKPEGKYLSVCFNEKDAAFEGTGKYRKTRFGGMVYLSSEKELRELFGQFFEIIDFRILETAAPAALLRKAKQRGMTHVFNYCFMQRKD
jgi:SAM-dependent methyltransferase